MEGLKNLTEKTNRGEAKATSEVILEHDSVTLRGIRDSMTFWRRHCTTSLEETVVLCLRNGSLVDGRRANVSSLAGHRRKLLYTNKIADGGFNALNLLLQLLATIHLS
jgi:hypothetical protein